MDDNAECCAVFERSNSYFARTSVKVGKTFKLLSLVLLLVQERISQQALNVIAGENRAGPKDRSRQFTFIFLQFNGYLRSFLFEISS